VVVVGQIIFKTRLLSGFLVCQLCMGVLRDAHTIRECLHTCTHAHTPPLARAGRTDRVIAASATAPPTPKCKSARAACTSTSKPLQTALSVEWTSDPTHSSASGKRAFFLLLCPLYSFLCGGGRLSPSSPLACFWAMGTIRFDRTLQTIVNKIFSDLIETDIAKEAHFYRSRGLIEDGTWSLFSVGVGESSLVSRDRIALKQRSGWRICCSRHRKARCVVRSSFGAPAA